MTARNVFRLLDLDADHEPTAEERLTAALVDLVDRNRRTPCADPDTWRHWTSEDYTERDAVAERCHACPIFRECEAAAAENPPRWGVWAGVDYDPRPRRKATT